MLAPPLRPQKVGTLEAIMVVCMVAGGPLWGFLADRCRAKKVGGFH